MAKAGIKCVDSAVPHFCRVESRGGGMYSDNFIHTYARNILGGSKFEFQNFLGLSEKLIFLGI